MTKRYGRNQKRKARARIASLESSNFELRLFLGERNKTISMANQIVEIAKGINPNHTLFSRAEINPNYFLHPIRERPSSISEPCAYPEAVDLRTVDLYDLEVLIDHQDFKQEVHFSLGLFNPQTKPHQAACKISKEGFLRTPTRVIIEELIVYLKTNLKQIIDV